MSFGKEDSDSRQSQGLNPGERVWFSDRMPNKFKEFEAFAKRNMNDVGGLQFQNIRDQILPMGRYGMSQGADEGISQLGRDMFTGASGSRAQRGFNTPYNLEAVLGDSMRMASSQLVPAANQFALQRGQMLPALRQAYFGYGSSPFDKWSNLLTGSSQGGASSNGFNFDSQIGQIVAGLAKSSDRKLKSDIVRIGTHPLGIGWYEYTIFGKRDQGVMADEVQQVMPKAVFYNHTKDHLMVDYAQIGRME